MINAVKREKGPVILCIYKIAAVCSSNDLLSSESSKMASTSLSKCMCDSHRKSADSDLSDEREGKGCEWAKAVAFYWEEHLHIQLYWELLLHYLTSTSEPLFMRMQRQCMVNLSLWIIHPFLKPQWTILFFLTILYFLYIHWTYIILIRSCLIKRLRGDSWREHLQRCWRVLQLPEYQQIFHSGC